MYEKKANFIPCQEAFAKQGWDSPSIRPLCHGDILSKSVLCLYCMTHKKKEVVSNEEAPLIESGMERRRKREREKWR